MLGSFVGNKSNIKLVKIFEVPGKFLATASNEVVNFTNVRTGEVEYQIYDREAAHGEVTTMQTSQNLFAIGYADGSILVFDLAE